MPDGDPDPRSHVLQLRPQRWVLHPAPVFPPGGRGQSSSTRVSVVCSLLFGRGPRSREVKASLPDFALALPFPGPSFQRDRSPASPSLLEALTSLSLLHILPPPSPLPPSGLLSYHSPGLPARPPGLLICHPPTCFSTAQGARCSFSASSKHLSGPSRKGSEPLTIQPSSRSRGALAAGG